MSKPEAVVLWTLNQTTHLLADEIEAIRKIFLSKQIHPYMGDRRPFNSANGTRGQKNPDSGYAPHNLMHEVDNEYDEYFVPIAFKCIGSRFEDSAGNPELAKILEHYSQPGFKPYRHFWDRGSRPRHYPDDYNSRMLTEQYTGYYQILCETAEKHGCQNILIGYSQGGLVARYLAYLDEYVFKQNVVAGVITVASPNCGSPVANPDNREDAVKNLQDALIKLAPILTSLFPNADIVPFLEKGITFEKFINKFDAIVRRAYSERRSGSISGAVYRGVASLRKWAGGLEADYDNAFSDLNAKCLDEPGSVLHSVHCYPPKNIFHAHILTAQNDLSELLAGVADFSIWLRVLNWIKHVIGLDRRMALAGGIYNHHVLVEAKPGALPDAIQPRIAAYSGDHPAELPDLPRLPPQAHDFLVPSAYQYVQGAAFNLVNRKADHNSGREPKASGGKQNIRNIKDLLTILREHMS